VLFVNGAVIIDDGRMRVNRKFELLRMETNLGIERFRLGTKTEYIRCGISTTRQEKEEVSLDGQVVP
jgi:hypothetical protein